MDDAALLERMLAGDEDAFVTVVGRYHGAVVRVARAYVASDATAEDVAQETWMAVVRGLERFEGRSSFKTWLLRICANRARSIGVRERRSVPVDTTAEEPAVAPGRFDARGMWSDPPVPFTEEVEARLADGALADAVRGCIEELPPAMRAVVTLRDVEGLSTVDVAELLGLTEANVRVIVHRGRAKVRAALEALVGGGPA